VDFGPDGYMDNVTFQVSVVALPALRITVNRANGGVTLSNDTGAAVNLSAIPLPQGSKRSRRGVGSPSPTTTITQSRAQPGRLGPQLEQIDQSQRSYRPE